MSECAGPREIVKAVLADQDGRYQLLCANCNATKKIDNREFGDPSRFRRSAVERRLTRRYLTQEEIAELARLVAVEGVPQTDVAERYGLDQPVVSVHTRKRYPDYNGREVRAARTWYRMRDRPTS